MRVVNADAAILIVMSGLLLFSIVLFEPIDHLNAFWRGDMHDPICCTSSFEKEAELVLFSSTSEPYKYSGGEVELEAISMRSYQERNTKNALDFQIFFPEQLN